MDTKIRIGKLAFRVLIYGLGIVVFLLVIFFMSQNVEATTTVSVGDATSGWINEGSQPHVALNLTIHNNTGGTGNTLNWVNVTFYVVSGFDPSADLNSLASGASSGVAIYNESNAVPGFQPGDQVANNAAPSWDNNGTHWWVNISINPSHANIPSLTQTNPNWYVVIRTSGGASNNVQFRVNITANAINGTWGNTTQTSSSSLITIDTVDPSVSVDQEAENSIYLYSGYGTTTQGAYGSSMGASLQSFYVNGTASDGLSGVISLTDSTTFGNDPSNTGSVTSWNFEYRIDNNDNGVEVVTYTATDRAGNTGTATYSFTEDNNGPSITDVMSAYAEAGDPTEVHGNIGTNIFYFSNSFTGSATVTFDATGTDGGVGVRSVDFGAWGGDNPAEDFGSPFQGSYTVNNADSSGTIQVTFYDHVGNSNSASITCTEDTDNPSISVDGESESSIYLYMQYGTGLQGAYGSGMGLSTQTFTISGSSSDGTSGVASVDDDTSFGNNPSRGGTVGSWSFDYDIDQNDNGLVTVTYTATDNVGNTNTATYTFYEDNANPTLSDAMSNYGETGDVDEVFGWIATNTFYFSNSFTTSATCTFTATGSDSGVAGVRGIDFGAWGGDNPPEDTGAPYEGAYTVNNGDSSGTITVTIYDNVGNSDSATITCTQDTTSPGIDYYYPKAGENTTWYNSNPGAVIDINFTWGGSEAPLHNASYQIASDGWVDIFTTDEFQDNDTNWAIAWGSLAEGLNQISIRTTDAVGNTLVHSYVFNTSGFGFLKDSALPTINYNSPSAGGDTSWYSSNPGAIINIDFGKVGLSPLVNASYRIGSGSWVFIFNTEQAGDYITDWSIAWNNLAEGPNQISIRVFTKAGNSRTHIFVSTTSGFRFFKDTVDPGIIYNSPVIGGNTSWYSSDPGLIIDIDFQWVANSPLSYAQYQVGTGSWMDIFTADQSSNYVTDWNISWSALLEGENEINIRVADLAGNVLLHTYSLDTSGFIFKKDSQAPVGISISINSGAQYANNESVTLTISATDATSGIYQMKISNDGVFDTETWETYSTSKLWILSTNDGLKNVTIIFRDNALLESVVIYDAIFLDTITPSISEWLLTPGNVTEDTTGNLNITITITDGLAGSGILNVELKYVIEGIANTNYQDMEYIGDGKWRFIINASVYSKTWDELQDLNINYTVRVEDNAGNVGTSLTQSEFIDPINDPPVIAGAPTAIILVIGDDYIIDFSAYISDVDNDKSDLILTTNSNNVKVNGFTLTFNYPTVMTTGSVEVTVSDGSRSAKWIIQITVNPKIVTITKDYVTVKILLTTITTPEVNTKLTSPGIIPTDKQALGEAFNISIPGGAWDWIYITVDYSSLDASGIKDTSLLLYYWDSSTSSWKVCELTQPEVNDQLLWANVTQPGTFIALGQPTVAPPDNDGDNIPDSVDPDDDNDNMPDIFEGNYTALDPFVDDAAGDIDEDDLSNLKEYQIGTDPTLFDTDADGMDDGWENKYGLDPKDPADADLDLDDDGYSNLKEYKEGSLPNDADSTPKKDTTDNFATIIGIIIVIIIIIILVTLMMLRRRGGMEPGPGELPPGEPGEGELGAGPEGPTDEFEEVRPDLAEEYEVSELEEGVEPEILKPEVTTLPTEGVIEVLALSEPIPCSVCQGEIDTGATAIHCACGLILHPSCAGDVKECPLCGRVYDFEELGIPLPEEVAVKPKKPLIRKEIKREVKELPPPESAYFVYIPEKIPEKDLNNYVEGYLKSHQIGSNVPNELLKNINIFIGIDAAKKMMEHCYKHGRVKEVMGLILGETYEHNGKTFSVAKDVATSELDATEVNVRFDNFEKLFDQLEGISYDYQILGWYHSHPDYSSFLSPTDIDTNRRMFKQPYQYAIVIDPIRFEMKAFTHDRLLKKRANELPYAIVSLDKFKTLAAPGIVNGSAVAGKPKSKPMIRAEVKQEREKLDKIPDKSYLSYLPGVTNDKLIKDYLTEYFKSNNTGKPSTTEGIGTGIQLLVSVAAAKKMWDHCFKFRDVKEVMGLLIGKVYDYNEDKTISIVRDVVTSDLDATVVNVKFDSFDKLFEQLDSLKYDYQILGWYHSHPGHTCFMSSTDVLTQQRMFKLPYQHALVIDPINNDMKCFALDQSNKKKVKARGYAIIDN